MKIDLKPNEVLFKQEVDGVFYAKNGYKIIKHIPVDENDSTNQFILIDPNGQPVGEPKYIHGSLGADGWMAHCVHWARRKRSDINSKITWSPAHFTKGTLIRVCDTLKSHHEDEVYPEIYEVAGVTQNGPNSFCIQTTYKRKTGYFKGTLQAFNISYVRQIVSRPPGLPAKDADPFTKTPLPNPWKKNWMPLGSFLRHIEFDQTLGMGGGTFADEAKLYKRLKAMGLVRTVTQKTRDRLTRDVYFVHKDAKKFILKNPHWAIMTVKAAVKQEASYYDLLDENDDREVVKAPEPNNRAFDREGYYGDMDDAY